MTSKVSVAAWAPDPSVEKWASKRGFGRVLNVDSASLREFATQHDGHPIGLYLWESADHRIYIGISEVSVVTRLRNHLRTYSEASIRAFRFRPLKATRAELRDVERGLVHEAIHDGFTVFNSEYSSTIYGDSTLDVLLPVSEQAAWFENPIAANRGRPYVRRDRQQPALAHSELKFRRFSQRPDAEMILDALSLYLTSCTPFPRLTESDYWGLSSPGWKNKGWTRVITLNMSFLEVLWMVEPRGGSGVSVNMGVDYQFLPPKKTEKVLRKFGAEMLGSLHKSGGPFEEVLSFDSVRSFTRAMQDSQDIRTAAARFALDRMRRGYLSGRYRDSHDVLLTGEALGRMSKWDHLGR